MCPSNEPAINNMNNEEQEQKLYTSSATKPCKTWFFERTGDGFIFPCDETEAWNILNNRSTWIRKDFKMLGMSDGTLYFDIIRNAKHEKRALVEKRAELDRDYQRYSQTEERLRFTELKDDSDEMVIKVKAILSKLVGEIQEIDAKIQSFDRDLIKKAFDAELERARGNLVRPENHDIITPRVEDRQKILSNIKM
jgi:hypothetical protein